MAFRWQACQVGCPTCLMRLLGDIPLRKETVEWQMELGRRATHICLQAQLVPNFTAAKDKHAGVVRHAHYSLWQHIKALKESVRKVEVR